MIKTIEYRIFTVSSRPKQRAVIYVTMLCTTDIGIIGRVYPRIKSVGVIGVVYSLCKSALCLSFEMRVAEKSVINERPNTHIPGVRLSISNRLTGMLACIALKSSIRTSGNPNPKARFSGSRNISFVFLDAKATILSPSPP